MRDTVGDLKLALVGIPDDTPVVVDNCQGILDNAGFGGGLSEYERAHCGGGSFSDGTEDGTKFFAIYSD